MSPTSLTIQREKGIQSGPPQDPSRQPPDPPASLRPGVHREMLLGAALASVNRTVSRSAKPSPRI